MFSGVPSGRDFYFTIYQTPCVWLISNCPVGTIRVLVANGRRYKYNRQSGTESVALRMKQESVLNPALELKIFRAK